MTRDDAMTTYSPTNSLRPFLQARAHALASCDPARQPGGALKRTHGVLLIFAGLLGVALIALLDRATDSLLSFSMLYLLPVAACAWFGGFSHGIFVALTGSLAWHAVDWFENPALPPEVRVWNGVLRFGTLALLASIVSRLRVSVLRERLLARTDALTGAANGRTFYETAAVEAERARRASRPMTLAYFDLDDFKLLNDRLGHAAGDNALRCVVHTIQLHLRGADLLARLGGDEFALLLPETGPEGAVSLLARLQEHLACELSHRNWPVTLSVGAVTFIRPLTDIDVMIQQVDAVMYAAKRNGKGRVEHAVVEGGADDRWPAIDRRATARALCGRTARIRRKDHEADQEEFATVRDISLAGISLLLDEPLPEDTIVVIDPLAAGVRTLLARVKRSSPDDGRWRLGCELSTRLSADEFHFWTGQPACRTGEGAMQRAE
jgi:diguanylate cyclase (GGDEF)-like protein